MDPQGARVERQRVIGRAVQGGPFGCELQEDRDVRMVRAERLDPLLELPALELLEMPNAVIRCPRGRLGRTGLDRCFADTATRTNTRAGGSKHLKVPPSGTTCRASHAVHRDVE